MNDTKETAEAKKPFRVLKRLKKPSKNMFWLWIAYQTVKGTLTMSFIWIPLFYMWFHH